jgi:hypothetical protein
MKYFSQNQAKLKELKPEYQFALDQFLVDADAQGLEFRVTEAFRSQDRQDALYAQGRWKPGPIVTWTLFSNHTKREAFDVHAINCSYEQIEEVANRYGIFRDPVLLKLHDYGHFETRLAIQPPTEPKYTPQAISRAFQRAIKRALSPAQVERLKKRFSKYL